MDRQMEIMERQGMELIGKTLEVLVEGYDRYAECWVRPLLAGRPPTWTGRSSSPPGASAPRLGSFVQVRVEDCMDCDLTGRLV